MLEDAVTLNPSMIGFFPIASLSGTLNWVEPGNGTRMYHAGAIDGRNEYVGAGVSFTRNQQVDVFHLAFAKQTAPWLSAGLHAKRFTDRKTVGYDAGASATFATPKGMLAWPLLFALTADNLAHVARNERFIGPRQLGAGAKLNINEILLLYADFVESFSHERGTFPSYGAAAELALGNDFFARGGGFGFRGKGWGAGGGWVGPRIAINYGYQRQTFPQRATQQAVTLDIYM